MSLGRASTLSVMNADCTAPDNSREEATLLFGYNESPQNLGSAKQSERLEHW